MLTSGAAIVVAGVLVALYVVICLRRREWPETRDFFEIALCVGGIFAGAHLVYLSVNPPADSGIGDDRLFIAMGGVALIFLSIEHFAKAAQEKWAKKSD